MRCRGPVIPAWQRLRDATRRKRYVRAHEETDAPARLAGGCRRADGGDRACRCRDDAVAAALAVHQVADAAAFLAVPRPANDASFMILSHDFAEPRLVGGIGLRREARCPRTGLLADPGCMGSRAMRPKRGTRCCNAARYALGLKRIAARHFADNPASGAVLRKLGFRPVGRSELHIRGTRRRRSIASSWRAIWTMIEPGRCNSPRNRPLVMSGQTPDSGRDMRVVPLPSPPPRRVVACRPRNRAMRRWTRRGRCWSNMARRRSR